MTIRVAKRVKAEYAGDPETIEKLSRYLKRFMSSIADEYGDRESYFDECVVAVQMLGDGSIVLSGSLERQQTPYYQEEEFDKDAEIRVPVEEPPNKIPGLLDPEYIRQPTR